MGNISPQKFKMRGTWQPTDADVVILAAKIEEMMYSKDYNINGSDIDYDYQVKKLWRHLASDQLPEDRKHLACEAINNVLEQPVKITPAMLGGNTYPFSDAIVKKYVGKKTSGKYCTTKSEALAAFLDASKIVYDPKITADDVTPFYAYEVGSRVNSHLLAEMLINHYSTIASVGQLTKIATGVLHNLSENPVGLTNEDEIKTIIDRFPHSFASAEGRSGGNRRPDEIPARASRLGQKFAASLAESGHLDRFMHER